MKLKAHKNLNARSPDEQWSYYPDGSKTVSRTRSIVLRGNIRCKQPSLKNKRFQITLQGGKRSVYAWIHSDDAEVGNVLVAENLQPLRFNPKLGHLYFQDNDGNRVDSAALVYLAPDGNAYFTPEV